MNEEINNVVANVAEETETIVKEVAPKVVTTVRNNPAALIGCFVGGAVTAVTGFFAAKGIKSCMKNNKKDDEEKKDDDKKDDKKKDNK